ncbi:conserved hypothetical protein [Psychromonas ingrahamii 37]|uniref:DUF2750 domain-containing protein n=1 Tax=Psychromonas ingrahamii (strain DSM 17664 / CCUG 51855 / 37) TaxID=357804 RepID=A1ST86_PSYIN|nr:DUF2750 domain-containing protein [Psychromonas ingrahamii]ABM02701.1 conserved hypothetical protein [Psychromonas ingrahamii 37]
MKEQYLKNAEKFVEQVTAQQQLFGLYEDSQGWANCHAHDNKDATAVYLFWSEAASAEKLRNEEWANYQVQAISLSLFLESWLDGMQKQQVFAGLNWDENLYGLEIEAMVLKNSLFEKSQELTD